MRGPMRFGSAIGVGVALTCCVGCSALVKGCSTTSRTAAKASKYAGDDAVRAAASPAGRQAVSNLNGLKSGINAGRPLLSEAELAALRGWNPAVISESTLGMTRGALDDTAVLAAQPPTRNTRIIAIAPKDEQAFKGVFENRVRTASAEAEMLAFRKRLSNSTNDVVFLDDTSRLIGGQFGLTPVERAVAKLSIEIAAAESRVVVLTGHSVAAEGGARAIVMPNGVRVPLDTIHQTAKLHGKNCVVVTCHSPDLGLRQEIGFRDVASLMVGLGRSKVPDTTEATVQFLRSRYSTLQMQSRIRVTVIGTATVGGLYATYDLQQPNPKLPWWKTPAPGKVGGLSPGFGGNKR